MNHTLCPFCSQQTFEEHNTIVFQDDHQWTIAGFGQFSDCHLLYVPKLHPRFHASCLGEMSKAEFRRSVNDIENIKNILRQKYRKNVLFFEHGGVGQTVPHAHAHFYVGVPKIEKVLYDRYLNRYDVSVVSSLHMLRSYSKKRREPYLLWQDGGTDYFNIIWNPEAEPQVLRLIAANAVDMPQFGDWRTVHSGFDHEQRNRVAQELSPRFSPHMVASL